MKKTQKTKEERAAAAVVSDAATAEQPEPINARLVYQYRRAESAKGQFVREATAFGAMLMEAEKDILAASFVTAVTKYKTSKKGRWGEGRPNSGIEDWLAQNCPEINYSTARSYKALAQKMVAMMGGPQPAVLAALAAPWEMRISYEPEDADGPYADDVETVSDEVISARERLFTDATSRRKLEQMYFDFMRKDGRDGAGSSLDCGRDGAGDSQPLPTLTKAQAAERIWAHLSNELAKRTARDAVLLLPAKTAAVVHGQLLELLKLFKEQMEVRD